MVLRLLSWSKWDSTAVEDFVALSHGREEVVGWSVGYGMAWLSRFFN